MIDTSNDTMTEKKILAYKRKVLLRKKHRKVRVSAVYAMPNIRQAVRKSRKGKEGNKGVVIFDRHAEENILSLQRSLMDGTYHTSEGHDCMRQCPCGKVRKLHKLPYFPDHVGQHSLMQVLMPHLVKALYIESGASVKGRGMMYAKRRTERWVDEHKYAGHIYFVKLDFVKFYENVDQQTIYDALCLFFTDKGIRHLLHEVIFALPKGLGIGLYPIQTLTNFYMSVLCRMVCRDFNVKVEIYCDDIVVLGLDKKEIWKAVHCILDYAQETMHQPIHDNFGMQIIDETHFLDFVGYRFYINHTELRKRMKRKFQKKMHNLKDPMRKYRVAMSYKGWLMHCNGFNLWRRTTGMNSFDDFKMPTSQDVDADGKRIFEGQRMSASYFAERVITFLDVELGVASKVHKSGKSNVVSVEENGQKFKFFTNNKKLIEQLTWCRDNDKFPFLGKLRRANQSSNPDFRIVGTKD